MAGAVSSDARGFETTEGRAKISGDGSVQPEGASLDLLLEYLSAM